MSLIGARRGRFGGRGMNRDDEGAGRLEGREETAGERGCVKEEVRFKSALPSELR
jgi:hypothetical protein